MTREHRYSIELTWTGNTGDGTRTARSYERAHEISGPGLPSIAGSSDPAFRGDASRWNPEQLFVAALSQCHMLWYLALAAAAGIVVTAYDDTPTGTMIEEADGSGRFASVTLNPRVTVAPGTDLDAANGLHGQVEKYCFIARSVSVPIHHNPTVRCVAT